jgi:S-DNA-T family DNA segregation ATPase FtsK/SpoIIIE
MLISIGSDLIRVQCAYIDSKEIARIVNHIEAQQAPPNPFYLPYVEEEQAISTIEKTENGKFDELFADAARLIVTHQIGSTSLIQRKFSIGYARAGRIMDQLEQCKIVGPQEGSKTRQVLVQDFNTLEQILKDLGF